MRDVRSPRGPSIWITLQRFGGLCLISAGLSVCAQADQRALSPLSERSDRLVEALEPDHLVHDRAQGTSTLPALKMRLQDCDGYPYESSRTMDLAHRDLLTDLRAGLETGLSCLAGQGPMGRLHPYHEYQAHRLVELLNSEQPKTLRCIADQMFATAVATSPGDRDDADPLARPLSLVEHPGVVIDTYRLGGLLSRTHDDETFRSFFHLSEAQIVEHRHGQPIRAPSLHRFEDRSALLFHEVIHWLGHEHGAIHPDVTHLYETCCFGGSDYIRDEALNRAHQQTACAILRDDALWSQSYSPYKQMRIWHYKGYDELKQAMRADYGR